MGTIWVVFPRICDVWIFHTGQFARVELEGILLISCRLTALNVSCPVGRDSLRLQMHSLLRTRARSKGTEGHANTLSALETNLEDATRVLGTQHLVTISIIAIPELENTESSHLARNIVQYRHLTRTQKLGLPNLHQYEVNAVVLPRPKCLS